MSGPATETECRYGSLTQPARKPAKNNLEPGNAIVHWTNFSEGMRTGLELNRLSRPTGGARQRTSVLVRVSLVATMELQS